MLRIIVLLLLLLNSAYFAWTQGLLLGLGVGPTVQSEPQRLGQQIRPEAVRRLTAQELKQLEAAPGSPPKPAVCLQAGPFDAEQGAQLRQSLEALAWPAGAWVLEPVAKPGRWIIYMGKFANSEARDKKRAELGLLKIKVEPVRNPTLQPGLSLGVFELQAAANAALAELVGRGVRTARVVPEQAEVRGFMLRLPVVDEGLRSRLAELKPELADKALSACR